MEISGGNGLCSKHRRRHWRGRSSLPGCRVPCSALPAPRAHIVTLSKALARWQWILLMRWGRALIAKLWKKNIGFWGYNIRPTDNVLDSKRSVQTLCDCTATFFLPGSFPAEIYITSW